MMHAMHGIDEECEHATKDEECTRGDERRLVAARARGREHLLNATQDESADALRGEKNAVVNADSIGNGDKQPSVDEAVVLRTELLQSRQSRYKIIEGTVAERMNFTFSFAALSNLLRELFGQAQP